MRTTVAPAAEGQAPVPAWGTERNGFFVGRGKLVGCEAGQSQPPSGGTRPQKNLAHSQAGAGEAVGRSFFKRCRKPVSATLCDCCRLASVIATGPRTIACGGKGIPSACRLRERTSGAAA